MPSVRTTSVLFPITYALNLHNFHMKGILKLPLGIHSSCCSCGPLPLIYAICSCNICFVSYYICAQFTKFLYERNFETPLRNSFFLLHVQSSSLSICHLFVHTYALFPITHALNITQFLYERALRN